MVAAAAATAAVLLAHHRRRVAAIALAGLAWLALGAAWHHHRWSDLPGDDLARLDWGAGRPAWLRGTLAAVPEFRPPVERGDAVAAASAPWRSDAGTTRLLVDVSARGDGRGWLPASGRVLAEVEGEARGLAMGAPVELVGSLAPIAGPANPGEDDRRARWRAEGVRLRLHVTSPAAIGPDPLGRGDPLGRALGWLREQGHARLVAGLRPDVAPVAAALMLGRYEAIDPPTHEAFARTGTTHILAISGLHMQALAVALGWALAALGLGQRRAAAVVLLATVAYTILVGARPSVVRAAAMTVVGCLGILRDRPLLPASTLAEAALATLALNPAHLFDVGCQLSFVAVAAIVWGVPPLGIRLGLIEAGEPTTARAWLDRLERRLASWPRRLAWLARQVVLLALLTSTVAWVATAPIVASRFHLVPFVGAVLNVPLVLLSMPMLVLVAVVPAAGVFGGPLAGGARAACDWLIGSCVAAVRWGADLPGGFVHTAGPPESMLAPAFVVAGLALWLGRAPAPRAVRLGAWSAAGAAGLAMVAVAVLPHAPDSLEIEVLAVDHGLAVIVRAPSGRVLLYDCGRMGDPSVGRRVVAPALWARGVRRIDLLVLSHADADHYSGAADVIDRLPIAALGVPPGFDDPGAAAIRDRCRARASPSARSPRATPWTSAPAPRAGVLHPSRGARAAGHDNERSLVLDIESGERRALLTGDLEGAGLDALLGGPARRFAAIVAPHHGSAAANPPALYDWAGAPLVVVSQRAPAVGARAMPAGAAVVGRDVWRTWRDGAVRLRWTPAGLVASGFLSPRREAGP